MPDSHGHTEKSDDANAKERAREALERGGAKIKTPEQARHTLDSLEKIAGNLREEDVARAGSDAAPEQQAAAIEEAEDVPAAAKPASVILSRTPLCTSSKPGPMQPDGGRSSSARSWGSTKIDVKTTTASAGVVPCYKLASPI